MALLAELEQAWRGVELAAKNGCLKNQSMLVFAWWKAMHELRPDLHITCEPCADSTTMDNPDLIIWQNGETPLILFAGELKFLPDGPTVSKSAIAKLRHLALSETLMVPKRETTIGEITRHRMAKSEDCIFGLFIVGDRDDIATVYTDVTRILTELGRTSFHFVFGAVSTDPVVESSFQYIQPGERCD